MRSRLLDRGRTEELLAVPSLDAFIQALTNSPYGPDLQEALTRYQGIKAVDRALARNFHKTTRKILHFADGKARTLIELLLLRWDLASVRGILRGKHTDRSEAAIMESILPAGTLSEVALQELARQVDVPALAGALEAFGHPLGVALARGLGAYLEDKDLLRLELELDRFYAEYVLALAKGKGHSETVLREFVQAEIDALNVKTTMKLLRYEDRRDEGTRHRFFVPGGRIVDEKLFLALTRRDTAEHAWEVLRVRGFHVQKMPEDLTQFEKEVDLLLIRRAARLYLGDPLGIDVVVGYLTLKYNEVVNLRLIAHGKLLGIPHEMVRREMVGV